ncbi:hypothetical protein ACFX13_021932 [Malus domestica]|uniref:transcription factor HY5-like isoform X1 n=1 Tax=Malus domestica TaxID=3750 RepID=UPI000498D63F|nr:transcription factor HY5-like isoform X1 [Malus domestica]
MSVPIRAGDGEAKNPMLSISSSSSSSLEQPQRQPSGSSSLKLPHPSLLLHSNNKNSNKLDVPWFWSLDDDGDNVPEVSDEDMFMVPDVEALRPPNNSINNAASTIANATSNNNPDAQSGFPAKRHRGRNLVDKEYRRLKRLLRNRVSAQQARERKKIYVNDLESRAKELEDGNLKLEEKISTVVNENAMLRKVLMNTRPKVDEGIEQKQGSVK